MKTWSLSTKLYFILAILTVANLFTVVNSISKLAELNNSISNINTVLYKRIEFMNVVGQQQLRLAIHVRDLILNTAPDERKEIEEGLKTSHGKILENLKKFNSIAAEQGKAMSAKYEEKLSAWFQSAEDLEHLMRDNKQAEALALSKSKLVVLRHEMETSLKEIVDLNEGRMREAGEQAEEDYKNSRNQVVIIAILSILFSASLATYIIKKFSFSIDNIINSLNANADQVASASHQLASSSEELSQATTEQAASLEQTASSLEEITSMISKASESASSSEKSAAQSQAKANEGRTAVEHMMTQMTEISGSNDSIAQQVNQSNEQMSEIVRVIQEIGNKTKVINEIVFQTKLLSFNASVEAARAGEHGKGFAVVAEEVGNLAQMSGNAAKEISEMLEGSIAKVENIVRDSKTQVETLVTQGKEKVSQGVVTAQQCSAVLNEIVQNVSVVTSLSQEISQATHEQAQGVGEINKAMGQLDVVTQQNSAASEQTANAAEELSAQAVALKNAVQDLIVTVKGSSGKNESSTSKNNFQAKKTTQKSPAKNNVVSFSTTKGPKKTSPPVAKPAPPTALTPERMAADGSVPSHDHAGFKDV